MEQEIKSLRNVNFGSTGEVTTLSRMNPNSSLGLYVASTLKKKCQLVHKEREKRRMKKKALKEKSVI